MSVAAWRLRSLIGKPCVMRSAIIARRSRGGDLCSQCYAMCYLGTILNAWLTPSLVHIHEREVQDVLGCDDGLDDPRHCLGCGAFWGAIARRLPSPQPDTILDALGLFEGQAVSTQLASMTVKSLVSNSIRQSPRWAPPHPERS